VEKGSSRRKGIEAKEDNERKKADAGDEGDERKPDL